MTQKYTVPVPHKWTKLRRSTDERVEEESYTRPPDRQERIGYSGCVLLNAFYATDDAEEIRYVDVLDALQKYPTDMLYQHPIQGLVRKFYPTYTRKVGYVWVCDVCTREHGLVW